MAQRLVCRASHGNIVQQHRKLTLEIDAVRFRGKRNVFIRAQEVVTRTLVDQRNGVGVLDRLQVKCFLHQLAVGQEARTI